jgi:hypothetical protein
MMGAGSVAAMAFKMNLVLMRKPSCRGRMITPAAMASGSGI